jgi:hypothetical protein
MCLRFDRVKTLWTETGRNGNLLLAENSNCTKDNGSRGSNCIERKLHVKKKIQSPCGSIPGSVTVFSV